MSTYLMDVMCANIEFPSLEWKWEPSLPSVHVYYKMFWENKYKEDYDQICNKFFSTLYQTLFGEETPCLSPAGQEIVKELGDWYMTPARVYIRIVRSFFRPCIKHCLVTRHHVYHRWDKQWLKNLETGTCL